MNAGVQPTLLRRCLYSLVPVLLVLTTGELATRLLGTPPCEPVAPSATGWFSMRADPDLLWSLEPGLDFDMPDGVTRINAVGLRTPYLPTDRRQPGERRVLVTGDSSVYGWGQPDGYTYAELLEASLEEAFPSVPFSVVNLGVPGYSTEQTLGLLDRVGWAYEPDLVVVHNIFSDCNIDSFQDRDALALAGSATAGGRPILHSSRLYCAARMPWARYVATRNQEPNRVLMPGRPVGSNATVALEQLARVLDLSRVPLDDYLANLDHIREGCEQRGASMVVAPLAQEWDVGRWTASTSPPGPGTALPWFAYRQALDAWAAARGILHVPMYDAFSRYRGDEAALFSDQMHPTVLGAAVMASALVEALRGGPDLLGLQAAQLAPDWSAEVRPPRGYTPPAQPQPNGSNPRAPAPPHNPHAPGPAPGAPTAQTP